MPAACAVPPSIAGLSRLQCAGFVVRDPEHAGIRPTTALPAGAWTASLRQLGASDDALLLSTELLAGAGQLQQLCVLDGDFEAADDDASERFWRWCVVHLPLRQLTIEVNEDARLPAAVAAAVNRLRDARPALDVSYRLTSNPMEVGEAFHFAL